jgi:hypothetical protein
MRSNAHVLHAGAEFVTDLLVEGPGQITTDEHARLLYVKGGIII